MADTFEKVIHTLTEESFLGAGSVSDKRSSGPGASAGLESDPASIWKDKYLHLLADLENTKKRLARVASLEVEGLNTELLRDILPVADGLDLILTHISGEEDGLNILQGVKGTRDMLDKFFIKYNVKVIDAREAVFNPSFHEALGMVHYPGAVPNTVVRVERTGYVYRDRLLRPAQVLVAGG